MVLDTLAKNKQIPINKDIFRTYDIRGQVGTEWCIDNNFDDAYQIGQSIGHQLVKRKSANVVIGRDGRLTSEAISDKLIKGLLSTGCNVTDIGLTATPVLYFSLSEYDIPNGVMITGSHNPPDHNGIKIVYELAPLSELVIETLYFDILNNDFPIVPTGEYTQKQNTIQKYQQTIANDIQLQRKLRIGIDSSNGATSLFSESLFEKLGCEVHPLFCDLDGTFPNHSPDPTVPEHLKPLIELVKKNNLDIGIAFDGDGDRMIAVDSEGKLLWPDRIMILLAEDLLENRPNARIVFDVKCSFLLPKAIQKAGGQSTMCVSGHSILKMQMKRLNATMGGEFSGHLVMRDRWSDFDDGPYVAARLLEVLAKKSSSSAEIFSQIPDSYSTKEYKIKLHNHQMCKDITEQLIQQANFPGANLCLIDGLRVDYDDGWGLVRASNTSSSLGLRFEATTEKRLNDIKQQFRDAFKQTDYQQDLPF